LPYAIPVLVDVDPSGDLVSVIMRTRNRHELLREAIASVVAQDYRPIQLVIVNDGGEPVQSVIDPFQTALAITLLDSPSIGRCRAGNLGLAHARGTWITWLDDDDLYMPSHLSTLLRGVKASGKQVAYTDAFRLEQMRDRQGRWIEKSRTIPWSEDFSRIMMFRQSFIHLVTVMHHRSCFEQLGGFDPRLEVLEDWDMFFRFAQDHEFHHIKETTALFRIRDDQSNAVTAMRKEFVETRAALFSRYSHIAFPDLLNQLERGVGEIASLHQRIAELMRRVEDLESKP
jgi:glycosyltransferase involved in cell wall biosynthesis